MKKTILYCFVSIVLITACQQEVVEPTVEAHQGRSLSFSADEVNTMLLEEFGHTNIAFEDKMRFLSDYIVGNVPKNSSSGRKQVDYTRVQCVAGVWEEATGDWAFVIDWGLITDDNISASKTIRRPSPHRVGASASIYYCTDTYCEFVDAEGTPAAVLVTCPDSDVKATASSWRAGTGYYQLTAYVACD